MPTNENDEAGKIVIYIKKPKPRPIPRNMA